MSYDKIVLPAYCVMLLMSRTAAQNIEPGNRVDVRIACRVQTVESGYA